MMTEEAAVAQMAIVATLNLVCNQCVCVCWEKKKRGEEGLGVTFVRCLLNGDYMLF